MPTGDKQSGHDRRTFLKGAGAVAGVGVSTLSGCLSSLTGDGTTTLQANSPAASGSVHGDVAGWIGDIVAEETDGSVEIDAFSSSELGGQIESIENVSSGDLDMYVIPYALTGTQHPPAQVFDAPYMYDDARPYEHLMEVTDPNTSEAARTVIEDLVEQTNIRSLGAVAQGTRRVTLAGDAPATNPEELSEFLLRAVPIPMYEEGVVGLGAQTTEIDFSEVPQALATGSIDGQENPYNIIVSSGIHEHTDWVLETNHMHVPLAILINEGVWQNLTDDQQQIFYDAVSEVQPRAANEIKSSIEEQKDIIRDEGAEILPPGELDMAAFRSQTRQHIRETFPEMMDTIEELAYDDYQ